MEQSQELSNTSSALNESFEFYCAHFKEFCEKFVETPLESQSESLLEIKSKDLESRWSKLVSSYEKLMLANQNEIDDNTRDNARSTYNECVEAYYNCNSDITEMMKTFIVDRSQPHGLTSTENIFQNAIFSQPFPQENFNCIKLPPCDTEVFKGGYEQWPSFRDMFTAVYINHTKLTPVTKLYHLRNKTRGEAGAIVRRYPLSHDNFELAWNALQTRYENKRVLVDSQIKNLFDIPAAKHEDSESLRKIQSSVNDSLASLKTLGINVESWDPILIRLISTKLPEVTLSLWEQSLISPRELPQWSQLSQFLVDRYEALERLASIQTAKDSFNVSNSRHPKVHTYISQEKLTDPSCKLCNANHSLRTCPKFRNFTVQQRVDFVFKNKYCNNCLAASHLKANCGSKNTCIYCKKPHHSLLHLRNNCNNLFQQNSQKKESANEKQNLFQSSVTHTSQSHKADLQEEFPQTSKQIQSNCSTGSENILLRTALMQIEHGGQFFNIRALIDPGSQRTFLTERIRNRLQLPYKKAQYEVIGIGGQKLLASKECELVLFARRYNLRVPIKAIVLPKVTKQLPACSFEIPYSNDLAELDLADPTFNVSSQIDLILGNDYEQLLNIDTIFGWVLSGPIKMQTVQSFSTSVQATDISELNLTLRRFWEQEEIPTSQIISADDIFCETLYSQTTKRLENGRYIVRLPFKKEFPDKISLGSSRFIALAQYSRMEKTLSKNPELQLQYQAVLQEYLTLDHMEETSSQEKVSDGKCSSYYLPHHAVVRPDHKSTKVRVVFNASRKTKSQISLNDVLYTGPILQNDLMSIILNWRKYRYVFSGDVQKMYRQILVDPRDRPYQRILFQSDPNSPVKDYQLKTVTFGVNSAPYLAIRTLLQLATDSEHAFPKAAAILRKETYVDDILSGGYSIEETLESQTQLIKALKSGGFPLKKITANDPQLLKHLPEEDLYDSEFLRFHETSSTKTLGIKWNALTDTFTYSFTPLDQAQHITKRQILSSVAKLFDPAGWLAPIFIRAKILMQQLWLEGLQWDDYISSDSLQKWNDLVQDLKEIDLINVPRWLQYSPSDTIQIHGFVYVRCQTAAHTVFSNLLVAKCKVSPIQTVSLPRLELNGAVLLAKLIKYIDSSLSLNYKEIFLWTDSSIVLGWLSKTPSSWETYVANRISQIHLLAPNATWRHVSTHDNPADLGTRGYKPRELAQNSLWWQGPSWLHKPSSEWPNRNPLKINVKSTELQALHCDVENSDILDKFSSYTRALRVMCYVYRFFVKCRKNECNNFTFNTDGSISQCEMKHVKTKLIALSQITFYKDEYRCLSNSLPIANKSPLKPLNPFIDSNKIIRSNGRLAQSSLPYNERYPIILPGNSRFCQLYLSYLHTYFAHAECSQMCRMVQTEFHVFRLKPRVKKIIRHCKTCIIYKKQPCTQIMAPLPPERCNLSLPFQNVGIDFAGPFEIKTSNLRNAPYTKGYVSVFVCFSTKAIHLEICSDLTSAAFQAAFARFVGRRGLPQRVVSDNGRNFIGASKALEQEFNRFLNTASHDISQKYLAHGFEWKFIPPHAPHMGGVWEAAVKSFKFHLKRTAGAYKFTYEEFSTVLARIEGVLNSRPISALSEDPQDLTALTPGHFLRGAPLLAFPEQSYQDMSLINRWEKLKALHHQFSTRWKEDYLKCLHKRYKWRNSAPNLEIGDLVVVMDDLLPPHEWRLGRIENTFQGPDKNVRVADVRIATGVITRPIVKLCYLPLLNDENSK